jgi:hypothetical protein
VFTHFFFQQTAIFVESLGVPDTGKQQVPALEELTVCGEETINRPTKE